MTDDEIRKLAQEKYGRLCGYDEIEIDVGAVVSRGDDPGAWVEAWVWVSFPDDDS